MFVFFRKEQHRIVLVTQRFFLIRHQRATVYYHMIFTLQLAVLNKMIADVFIFMLPLK